MTLLTLEGLESYKRQSLDDKYGGSTQYLKWELSPWNHITSLANDILDEVDYSVAVGMQFTGPMGKGKTKFATAVAHHIHTLRPEFNIVWATSHEFKNLSRFLEELPKCQPVLIIFEDITSALKSMSDKDLHQNFNTLTRVRHILDPEKSETPIIIFTIGHYSKNLEKEFRNVLEFNAFLAWTNEEQTNIDTIAPKNTQARLEVKKYAKIYSRLASSKKFALRLGNGKKIEYDIKEGIRPACVVHNIQAKIIIFSKLDECEKCSHKATRKMVPAIEVYQKMVKSYGLSGKQALRLCLWRKGYYRALPRKVATASEFFEERVLRDVSTDYDELLKLVWTQDRKKPPKQLYHHRQQEEEIMGQLHDLAVEVPVIEIKEKDDSVDEFDDEEFLADNIDSEKKIN